MNATKKARILRNRIEVLESRIAPAFAAVLNLSGLTGANGFKINGEVVDDWAGLSVSGAGDVNGDGFDDVIIGAPYADQGGSASGASYVVFGKVGGFGTMLNLSVLDGTNGFEIRGQSSSERSGTSVSGAGDVNGDGFDDLIVGAWGAAAPSFNSGASYVVFGKAAGFGATLQVSTLNGSNGFKINGESGGDISGYSVGGAGDVNGDGFDDLLIGARGASPNGSASGASYVVFGKAGGFGATLNLSALDGSNGFKINGEAATDWSGRSVSGAGDVNGDGFDDLIIGAPYADPNGSKSGTSYVVFGKAGGFGATLNLSTLNGSNGFKIQGVAADDQSGRSASRAGDVNGDGFDDLIIGAWRADPNGSNSGASYVVFGKAGGFGAALNLSTLNGSNGFKIQGQLTGDYSGRSVSGAGDVNGDGIDDLIIGAYKADPNGSNSGASYVVFGAAGGFGATFNLSALDGGNGVKIQGQSVNDYSGGSVSGAGDVNGDGFADLIIGALGVSSRTGASYVVFGQGTLPTSVISISDVSVTEGNTGTANAIFTVSLSAVSNVPVTVRYATANGSAGSPGDYTAVASTLLTFAPGETRKTITAAVMGDTVFEANDTFIVNLSNAANAIIGDEQGICTIINDDTAPTISVGDASVTEGNAGTVNANFVVSLSAAAGVPVTVTYATVNGSAIAPGDYAALPATLLTFAPGETSKTITVVMAGDTAFEFADTFFVNLSNPGNATLGDAQGVGTILNDDTAPTISVGDASVTEGNAGTVNANLVVSLSAAAGVPVTVTYATVNGSAIAPGDYAALPATLLTFAPGETSKTISVVVFGNMAFEFDDTIFVNLSDPGNATLADAQGVGTILNDDTAPAISIGDVIVTEGNSGSASADFTVSLSAAAGVPVMVSYATANGTAASGDYTALSATLLTFAPGETSKTISVVVFGDMVFEFDDTFFVNLSGPVNATLGKAQGVGTILNDDTAPAITVGNLSVTEGNAGTVNADFIVSLSAAAGVPVTVTCATADGTAALGDYSAVAPTLLTFAPGETSKTISVAVLVDTAFEFDDTFFVNLSDPVNATLGDAQGVGTILNDDAAPAVSIGDVSVTEGNAGTVDAVFTVSLSAAAGVPVTLSYATAGGTAGSEDYDAVAPTLLTFAPGETSRTISVGVKGDLLFEFNDTFFVTLSAPVNATLGDAQGVGTILNDDAAPTISIGDVSVAEGNSGSVDAVFTVSLSAAAGVPATVTYATANGTAGSEDYAAVTATLLTFAPGETTKTISVAVLGDALFEYDDTFSVNLSGAVNATPGDAQGVATITNDDDQPVLSIADVSVIEGDAGTVDAVFTVSLSAAAGVPVLVTYATANGTAITGDYTAITATLLTFAPGETTKTISVAVLGDVLFEYDDTFFVNLADPVNATPGDAQGIATIINDDDQPVLSIGDVSIAEGNLGTANAVFTVSLSAAAGVPVTVTYATADGTAAAPGDYAALTETQVIFVPGETSRTITVAVTGDANFEVDETFSVNLTSPVNATLGGAQGIGTIINDDGQPTIAIADASVAEGDSGTTHMVFTVSLSAESFEPVTVTFATANGTAVAPGDYTALRPAQLVFAPRETGKTISVAVFGETLFENGADETFFVILGGAVNATIADAQATGTILNDDDAPAGVFTIDAKHPFTFPDANNDTVTVKLKGAGTAIVSLDGGVAGGADISEIALTGTDRKSALSVSVKKDRITGDGAVGIGEVTVAGVLKEFNAKAADLIAGGLTAPGVVKKITARNLVHGEIITGGVATDKFALTLGAVGDGTLIQSGAKISALKVAQIGAGVVNAAEFGTIETSAGGIAAEITSVGAVAKIIVKGGALSGEITAVKFGAVTVKGGDFSGTLTSLTPAATLAGTAALRSLAITGGDITGTVRVIGAAGTISVKSTKTGPGGSVTGASIVASAISALNIQRDLIASHILAGADLGADHAPGGGDDTFASGTIGNVRIGGSVSGASVIGAGLASTNATFKDGDDTILGGAASVVKRLQITGTAGADSYFASGLFSAPPKIAGAKIAPAEDVRFKVG